MKNLIIGAGNGGLAFGAKLIEKGIEVNLYDKFEAILLPIIANDNTIYLHDGENLLPRTFNLVTSNLEEALKDVNLIYVVTPAFAHQSVATELAQYVSDEQIIVLHPGRTGGALEVKRILENNGNVGTIVAEAETLLFACRKITDVEIKIYGMKDSVNVAVLPETETTRVTNELNKTLPYFTNANSIMETSLANIGAIFHPTPFLLNIGRVESKTAFKYYHEGITPTIAHLLEQIDKERLEIAKSYGVDIPSALDWLNKNYNLNEKTLYEAIQANNSYSEIYAPLEVSARYVLEDVPMSLVPLSQLAKLNEVNTPLINSIIDLAIGLYNQDFRETGRTLERMGLDKSHSLLEMSQK
ncbi:NAD/NADP octopine/nopaline dehydrogenase family protein [Sporosarcina oncorhynchi]|uniref:NAD/NADP octopine/nopaline dehydrogenase family protein n=1 Tax=Sporosarcina oncorhynchi TaxID=3056444 RepID=A0ABZ0L9D6_9BACL|nr:NAD/NADP octopine/nopaline dehydrogenase family protein [Sporosarcina sp. T2O-4]WOV88151.1 NAD/NADP octopine/nopaline dehydrogenase family protein [Sporosarcina sp. T2O-4]